MGAGIDGVVGELAEELRKGTYQPTPVRRAFIPAFGDYINAQLLGSPNQYMIGNTIQSLYLNAPFDYPESAALSFMMMAAVLIVVMVYLRLAGTGAFMGDEEEAT